MNKNELKSIYKKCFYLGNIMNRIYASGEHFELLKKHYNIATFENYMKPEHVAPLSKSGEYRFEKADSLINQLKKNKIKVHGHVLIWHNQTPSWLTSGTKEEVITNLENYIKTVTEHFKGKLVSWDVINEALSDDITDPSDWKKCMRQNSGWYKALGHEFIEIAFKTARACCSDILLFYNDYNLDNENKAIAARNMIKEINEKYKAEGNKRNLIDGVGMQAHYGFYTNVNNVRASIERFIDAGIKIAISELDVETRQTSSKEWRPGANSVMPEDQANRQAEIYADLFSIFIEYKKHITQVIMWGMDDNNSWKSIGNPCLFDGDLKPKPAFFAVANQKKLFKR